MSSFFDRLFFCLKLKLNLSGVQNFEEEKKSKTQFTDEVFWCFNFLFNKIISFAVLPV